MFFYYLRLARISILRHWGLSLLMVTAIGLGIGAAMTTVTVNYLMTADPIPSKSHRLHTIQLDNWDENNPFKEGLEPPPFLTYLDAKNLLSAKQAHRQTMHTTAKAVIEPLAEEGLPLYVTVRANTADFFTMFETPFVYGAPWQKQVDDNNDLVVVLSEKINERLFAGENSVGKSIKINGDFYKVVGVLANWQPKPRFYHVDKVKAFDDSEDIFLPFTAITQKKISFEDNSYCWTPTSDNWQDYLNSECVWVHFWVEFDSPAEKLHYRDFLNGYLEEQRLYGRFKRPNDNRINTLEEWFEAREVVNKDNNMLMAMAFLFLGVCLLNTIGLLLAKFLGKSPEIGLRQALGASKSTLFYQYMVESACIGVIGGLLGLLFAYLGLAGIELLYGEKVKALVALDTNLVVFAILLSIAATVLAGLYPTWRACNVAPASQLKSQ
ncbi:ABC transporter permease [Thalassomonas actiniarum]|uniref:ABC transporter permease n=1 Tax=Thalassomonas actiniarum TaxID=485447 RepID=A0AAE9YMY8_9GAMM|nr:ABC transporter permease [Thalassomonas actiniarum]WDD97756.1 ABC transporter permease [Thalassomonas actiniarum]